MNATTHLHTLGSTELVVVDDSTRTNCHVAGIGEKRLGQAIDYDLLRLQ
jgi:hypothetical protein